MFSTPILLHTEWQCFCFISKQICHMTLKKKNCPTDDILVCGYKWGPFNSPTWSLFPFSSFHLLKKKNLIMLRQPCLCKLEQYHSYRSIFSPSFMDQFPPIQLQIFRFATISSNHTQTTKFPFDSVF